MKYFISANIYQLNEQNVFDLTSIVDTVIDLPPAIEEWEPVIREWKEDRKATISRLVNRFSGVQSSPNNFLVSTTNLAPAPLFRGEEDY